MNLLLSLFLVGGLTAAHCMIVRWVAGEEWDGDDEYL